MRRNKGFTLMELMIVVVVIGILAAIAYPSYQDSVRKSRRSDGTAALMQVAQILERCYTEFNAYDSPSCSVVSTVSGVNKIPATNTGSGGINGSGYYAISSTTLTSTTYTIQAAPRTLGGQNNDSCGTYTLTQTGAKTPTTPGCW